MPELMKGKVYGERKHTLVFPVYAEVKYDEIRCHVKRVDCPVSGSGVEFLSYAGKPLHNMERWANAFDAFMQHWDLNTLDMGVLVNGNFNDSYRWVRSSNGIPKEKYDKASGKTFPALNHGMVEFYLFDCPDLGKDEFQVRMHKLDQLATSLNCTFAVPTSRPEGWNIESEAELDARFIEVRERGLEGLMVKTYDHVYRTVPERTDGWLKMKPEDTADGKIVGWTEAKSTVATPECPIGTPLGRAGSIDVVLEDGSTASPAGIEHALGRDIYLNPAKYLGQWVEFKYMERDRQGGYRHPSFVRFREAKQ